MAEIHICTAEGEQAVHPEERVVEMLRSGELLPSGFYWRTGMAQWESLATFQPAAPPPFIPPRHAERSGRQGFGLAPTGPDKREADNLPEAISARTAKSPSRAGANRRSRHHFRENPEPLTTVLQLFLIVCLGLTGFAAAHIFIHYNLVAKMPAGGTAPDVSELAAFDLHVLSPTEVGALIATCVGSLAMLIPYYMWIYQTNANCHGFSSVVRFSPGWAVGWNFIPFANLVMPCRVMQEIWKVSRNPRSWMNDGASVVVGLWWSFWLLRVVGVQVWSASSARMKSQDDIARSLLTLLVVLLFQLVYLGLLFAIATIVIQRQKRLVRGDREKASSGAPVADSAP